MKVGMNPSPRQESSEGPKCCGKNACAGSVPGGGGSFYIFPSHSLACMIYV